MRRKDVELRSHGYRVEKGMIQSRGGTDTELRRDGYRVEEGLIQS